LFVDRLLLYTIVSGCVINLEVLIICG